MVHILTVSVDGSYQRFKEEVPGTPVLDMSGVSGAMSVPTASAVQAVPSQSILFVEACLSGNLSTKCERQLDVPCRSPNYWNSKIESICGLEDGIWSRRQAWNVRRCGSSSKFREPSSTGYDCNVGFEWHQNKTVYALIEEGSLLDPGGAGLGHRDSSVVMEGRVTVSGGTVTFSVEEVSTMTSIVISLTMSVALAEEDTSLVFPGDSEMGVRSHYCFPRERNVDIHFLSRTIGGQTFHFGSNPDALL